MKFKYERLNAHPYFWRTVQQQEIDYVENGNGIIAGYEIKWNSNAKLKAFTSFKETYNADVRLIHHQNFRAFL